MEIILIRASLFCYLAAVVLSFSRVYTRKEGLYKLGMTVSGAGAVFHLAGITARGVQLGYFPLTNLYESLSFLAFLAVLFNIVIYFRYQIKALSLFILPSVFMLTFASDLLRYKNFIVKPEHKSIWLAVHGILNLIGLGAFLVHFLLELMYLIQASNLKSKKITRSSRILPPLQACDELGYKAMVFGFPFLTLGIITGGLWAFNASRGWKPLETLTLLIWVIFAFLIEARLLTGWRGRKAAYLSIIAFLMLFAASVGIILF